MKIQQKSRGQCLRIRHIYALVFTFCCFHFPLIWCFSLFWGSTFIIAVIFSNNWFKLGVMTVIQSINFKLIFSLQLQKRIDIYHVYQYITYHTVISQVISWKVIQGKQESTPPLQPKYIISFSRNRKNNLTISKI